MLRPRSEPVSERAYAALALEFAHEALAEAERSGCGNDEIISLCNQVIARRLRLLEAKVVTGGEPSAAARAQMSRDRYLLEERPDAGS
jgi:hypothetical protein